jgi:hypothetical protein
MGGSSSAWEKTIKGPLWKRIEVQAITDRTENPRYSEFLGGRA